MSCALWPSGPGERRRDGGAGGPGPGGAGDGGGAPPPPPAGPPPLRGAGLKLALVTNQSGVGRGFFGLDAVARVNERVMALLAREGVTIDEGFVCPPAPEGGCPCRKPGTRMLDLAAQRLGA